MPLGAGRRVLDQHEAAVGDEVGVARHDVALQLRDGLQQVGLLVLLRVLGLGPAAGAHQARVPHLLQLQGLGGTARGCPQYSLIGTVRM